MTTIQILVDLAERSYMIHVGRDLLSQTGTILSALGLRKTCVILTHPALLELYGKPLASSLKDAGFSVYSVLVPEGEESKSLSHAEEVLDQLFPLRLERRDTLIALGGGVIGDLCGFVASVYMRGINLVQIPTTLLAQVDASIGGKTAVNHPYGKNLIGTFYQPKCVIADAHVLQSLPEREFRAGLAEVVKYGMIWSEPFFAFLEANAMNLSVKTIATLPEIWTKIIQTSADIKAQVVSKDEKESELREILNYGHTIAHGIEAVFAYNTYLHGEAVAIGMVGESRLAVELGLSTEAHHQRLVALLKALGFSLTIKSGHCAEEIIEKMFSDKKVKQGSLRFVLNQGIGKTQIVPIQDEDLICRVIQSLMEERQ